MKNVAILGGSFNPPTRAHQALAEACLERSEFDEVWIMPSGNRLDKVYSVEDEHRLAMLGLLAQTIHNPRLQVSRLELDLPRPSQTIKTLGALAMQYPDVLPVFVFGADSYYDMPTSSWVEGDYIQKNVHMLIVPREGYQNPVASNVNILDVPVEFRSISSSQARSRQQAGELISHLVDPSIAAYMAENNLYR